MTFFEQTVGDVRFALRSMKRAPGFAIVALATLVLGIASFTSIFSYLNAIYFAALPYHDAHRIVALSEHRPTSRFATPFTAVSLDALQAIRAARGSFERIAAYGQEHPIVMFGREPQQIAALRVDTAFIGMFDLRPQMGRLLTPDEISGDVPVTMISDHLWRVRYGADPAVVGRSIGMFERSYRIVGVMQEGFRFPWQTDAIYPMRDRPDSGVTTRDAYVAVLGKLRPGLTPDDARSEMAIVASRLTGIDTKIYRGAQLLVRDEMLDRRGRQFLPLPSVFLTAGLFLLLITCANVANLFYVRAAERRGEMAIRASLGAGRGRLVAQTLAEGAVISVAAAAIGTWLSTLLVKLWLHFVPTQGFPSWFHVEIDGRVLAFAIGVTVLVTLAVGLAPALHGTRFDVVSALKTGADHGSSGRHATRGSKRGLVLQLALSVALFVATGLLVRSFQQLLTADFGYPADQIALAEFFYSGRAYERPAARMQFAENLVRSSRALPGLETVAIRGGFVAMRQDASKTNGAISGRLLPDGDTARALRGVDVLSQVVSDEYFKTLGITTVHGRLFEASDVENSAPVVVIGRRAAAALWGARTAVGRTLQIGGGAPLTVVGVVSDVRRFSGGANGPRMRAGFDVYLSTRQALSFYPQIIARGSGDVTAMRSAIVRLAHESDPTLLAGRSATMANSLDEGFLITKVFGGIIGAMAVAALLLSVIGIYGVAAFGIARRTREIGIRIALGGTTRSVIRLITTETLRFAVIGLGIGLVLAVGLARLLARFLFDVSPFDPVAYVVVAIGFGAVALLAAYLPARRVTRIDPLLALRSE